MLPGDKPQNEHRVRAYSIYVCSHLAQTDGDRESVRQLEGSNQVYANNNSLPACGSGPLLLLAGIISRTRPVMYAVVWVDYAGEI